MAHRFAGEKLELLHYMETEITVIIRNVVRLVHVPSAPPHHSKLKTIKAQRLEY